MGKHTALIEFSNVTFSFSDSKILFKDLSLQLTAGRFYLVQSPSGAGKSTFLRLINWLEEPAGGEILFNGRSLAAYSPPLLRRSILYIQQTPTAVEGTVRDNLLLEPEVLLRDEPASALDEQSSRIVEHTAERLCADDGLTVLMVSHRRFEPRQVKPHMIRIAGGRVEESL